MKKDLTNEEIIGMYERLDVLYSNIKENKTYGFDLDVYSFFLRHRYAKTQIYGLRVQAYLCTLLKYKTTPSSEDCGDFKTRESEDVEFKCSFLDKYSKQINIKQIRPWQNLDWYYIFTIDYSDYKNLIYKCYKLSKKEMADECLLMNAKPVHSTKKNNIDNDKIELGLTIKLETENYFRWEEKYLNKKLDLQMLSDERLNEISTANQYLNEIEKYKLEIERLKKEAELLKQPAQEKVIIQEIKEIYPEEKEEFIDTGYTGLKYSVNDLRYYLERVIYEDDDGSLKEDWVMPRGGYNYKTPEQIAEEKQKRIEAISKIPHEFLLNHFNEYKLGNISFDYLFACIDFEISKLKKKRKKKEKTEGLNISQLINKFNNKELTDDEFQNAVKNRMIEVNNRYLKEIDDEESFSYTEKANEQFERLRREASVY